MENLTRYTCCAAEGDYGAGMEPSWDGDYVSYDDHQRVVDALQAQIDRLMLEHCPEEMTTEQKKRWKDSQVPAPEFDSAHR